MGGSRSLRFSVQSSVQFQNQFGEGFVAGMEASGQGSEDVRVPQRRIRQRPTDSPAFHLDREKPRVQGVQTVSVIWAHAEILRRMVTAEQGPLVVRPLGH